MNKQIAKEISKQNKENIRKSATQNIDRDNIAKRDIQKLKHSYQGQFDKLNRERNRKDQVDATAREDAMAQKEVLYSDIFKEQNVEHNHDFKNLKKSFDQNTTGMECRAKEDEARREEILTRQLDVVGKD